MRSRKFMSLLGGAVAAWPLKAHAQQSTGIKRVGVLMGTAESDPDQKDLVSAFSQALADLDWKEGANIHIEYRWAAGDTSHLPVLAAELGRLAPDAIFVQGTPATTALRRAISLPIEARANWIFRMTESDAPRARQLRAVTDDSHRERNPLDMQKGEDANQPGDILFGPEPAHKNEPQRARDRVLMNHCPREIQVA